MQKELLGKKPFRTNGLFPAVNWFLTNIRIFRLPHYLCDLVFVRPDGYPVVTLSYWAHYKSGKIKLPDALTDHAWVTLKEAKKYDLIDGIWDELKLVDSIIKKS